MPLPGDSTLSLQVHSNPGDPLHSKPKRAMIVRMSPETLEALENFPNQPKMDFMFGPNPGIHIGESFFPMKPIEESVPHELYLRTSSAQRPSNVLKLYANVTGKFMVDRELGEKVQERVRDRTIVAEQQRTERKAILLDAPPDVSKPTKSKKSKEARMFTRPVQAAEHHKNLSAPSTAQATRYSSPKTTSLPASTQHTRPASPLPSSSRPGDFTSSRLRLIHCLALFPRTTDEVVKRVVGSSCNAAARKEIIDLLEEVAELVPTAKQSTEPRKWQLKLSSWTEVRPLEWPTLASNQRLYLSRQARTAFRTLRIPESDPIWEHARYREPDTLASVTSVGQAESSKGANRAGTPDTAVRTEARNAITKQKLPKKGKKADGAKKKKGDDIIVAKDESVKPSKELSAKGATVSTTGASSTTAAAPSVRKPPGSGFKAKPGVGTPLPSPTVRAASPVSSHPPKRTGPVDVRESKRELPAPSGSAKPAPPIPPPPQTQERKVSGTTAGNARSKKVKAPSPLANEIGFDREPERGTIQKKRKKREEQSDSEPDEPVATSLQKKRRLEEAKTTKEKERGRGKEKEVARERVKERDPSPPRKALKREGSPLVSSPIRVKKESSPYNIPPAPRSPLPPSRLSVPQNVHLPSSSSSHSTTERSQHPKGPAKRRRGSVNYTSSGSSSEEDSKVAVRRSDAKKERATRQLKYKPRFRPRAVPLPADHEGLRKYYKACWAIYISLYSEKANFILKTQNRLQNNDNDSVSLSDSGEESQLSLMDPAVAKAFAADLKAVEQELQRITQALEENNDIPVSG